MPVVLSLLAHPDDAEFLCAGVLIRLKREYGFDVHIATMTAGDCGSIVHAADEIARIRRAENVHAASHLGAQSWCLDEKDLLVFANERTLEKATRLLRLVRPDLVLTHSPADYMLDHEQTSAIVRAAAFAAPIPNFLPTRQLGAPLPKIPYVYYCDPIEGKDALGRDVAPGIRIDITGVIDAKAEMLARHASQREWLMKHHGLDQYVQAMRDWAARRGREMGVGFAEGYRQHLGHSYPRDDLISRLLGSSNR